jgi:hypothetical protein
MAWCSVIAQGQRYLLPLLLRELRLKLCGFFKDGSPYEKLVLFGGTHLRINCISETLGYVAKYTLVIIQIFVILFAYFTMSSSLS